MGITPMVMNTSDMTLGMNMNMSIIHMTAMNTVSR